MSSVYQINKGINKSIEFRGLKAQYIWYMGGSLVLLMVIFAIMYVCGLNQYLCLLIILALGSFLVVKIYRLSDAYGEHGLMKRLARKSIPAVVKNNSRRAFLFKKEVMEMRNAKYYASAHEYSIANQENKSR